jgi:hypothetical protein
MGGEVLFELLLQQKKFHKSGGSPDGRLGMQRTCTVDIQPHICDGKNGGDPD